MALKDTWTPQDDTMVAGPEVVNIIADAVIQNEEDIKDLKENGGGGTTEGGDFNYNGIDGVRKSASVQYGAYGDGVSVGVYIPELMRREVRAAYHDSVYKNVIGGYGILGYGASGGSHYGTITPTGEGAVIIIPLELEE